jgi:hypothetical protein
VSVVGREYWVVGVDMIVNSLEAVGFGEVFELKVEMEMELVIELEILEVEGMGIEYLSCVACKVGIVCLGTVESVDFGWSHSLAGSA